MCARVPRRGSGMGTRRSMGSVGTSKITQSQFAAATWPVYRRTLSPRKKARVSSGGDVIAAVTPARSTRRSTAPAAARRA